MPQTYSAKQRAWQKAHYAAHREEHRAYSKAYYITHREEARIRRKAYNVAHREERKMKFNIWYNDNREKHRALVNKRDRTYGYNMLNEYFANSVGHHINDSDVVFIPKEIHRVCLSGKDKELHRERVMILYGNLENMIRGCMRC